jgi:cytochrome P450
VSDPALRAGIEPFDAEAPDFTDDPFRVYARYRRLDPVHWRPSQGRAGGRWFLFRHADVVQALSSPAIGREAPRHESRPAAAPPAEFRAYFATITDWMIFRDAPLHTRLRTAFLRAQSGAGVHRLRSRIEALARELLQDLPSSGNFDLLGDFAFALPVRVIAELMGLPFEDWARLRGWSNSLGSAIDLAPSPAVLVQADRSAREMTDYLKGVFAERRRDPRGDLVSELLAPAAGDDSPTEAQLVANCIFLLCAGHETTTNLISSGLLRLLQHPEQLRLLREHPEHLPRAVEEFLRFDSSVQSTSRVLLADCEIGGRRLERGQHLDALLGAANHDPAVFADPERLDVLRSPNPHLAFGAGAHACLGAGLARMEAEIAIRTCLERFPHLRLAEERPRWRASVAFRGLEGLPVVA